MPKTYSAYTEDITNGLNSLPQEKQFFFCVWCAQHLFDQYGSYIPEQLSPEAAQEVSLLLHYLWQQVDHFDNYDAEELESNMERIQTIDEDGILDLGETIDCGISNLQGAIMNSLIFLRDKDIRYAIAIYKMIITVIETYMDNELGLSSPNADMFMDHPLMKDELDTQMQLIDHAQKGSALSSADRNIFRSE